MASNATATLTVKLRDMASPKFKAMGAAARGLQGRLRGLNRDAAGRFKEGPFKKMGKDLGQLRRNLGGVASMATRAGVAVGGLGAVAAGVFARGVVDAAAQMEMMETALVTMTGSLDSARDSMKWISEFSDRTPFELDKVGEAYTRLMVLGIEPTEQMMRTMGDTAAAMGKPMLQPIEAIADAMQGSNERLKELGISASVAGKKVTFAWQDAGKTVTKTVDRTNKGLVADTIATIWNSRYQGSMDRMSKTWTGLMSTLRSKWFLFQVAVARSGLFDKLKKQLENLLSRVNQWAADGTLERWAKQIGDAFGRAFDGIVSAFEWLQKNWPEIKATMKEAWRVLTKEVAPAVKEVASTLWAVGKAASDAVGGPKNLIKILAALTAAKILAPLGGIASTLGSIGLSGAAAATGVDKLALKLGALKVLAAGAAGWAFGSLLDSWIGKVLKLRGELLSTELALKGGESTGFNRFVADVGEFVGSDTLRDAARGNMRRNLVDAQMSGDRVQALRSAGALAGTARTGAERSQLAVDIKVDQDGRVSRVSAKEKARGGMQLKLGQVAVP